MRRLIMLFVILSVIFPSTLIFAEIPHYMQFQGKATDSQDMPLNGSYKLTFRIYDVGTGSEPIWDEIHNSVDVESGVFSVLLGSVDPEDPLDISFDIPYWISIEIGTTDQTNELPRQMITSVAYAYKAGGLTTPEVPSGVIAMWSGSIASIPEGWALCDGTNGTPDLRDKFIVGARQDDGGIAKTNVKGTLQRTGGEHEHILTIAEMPAHTHTCHGNPHMGGSIEGFYPGHGWQIVNSGSTGGNQAHENCPPFYALAFIMKL